MSLAPHHVLAFQHEDIVADSPAELVAELIPLHLNASEELAGHLRHEFAVTLAEEAQARFLIDDSRPEAAAVIHRIAGRTLTGPELQALGAPRDDVPWRGAWEWPTPLVLVGPAPDVSGNVHVLDPTSPETLLVSLGAAGLLEYTGA